MRDDDTMYNLQAQPGAFSDSARGIERLKYTIEIASIHTSTRILDAHPYRFTAIQLTGRYQDTLT